jgi:hypothetical protein
MKKFGETVEGYKIPVLNEREIRASAGILFLLLVLSLMHIIYTGNFIFIKYFIVTFLVDFIIRVFVNPKYSPTLIIGRLIVSKQFPEYVGAAPKKFAWIIGIVLASIMFALLVIVNTYSPITGTICLICLVFLFFESVFGICLGCLFYPLFFKEKAQLCAGDICEVKTKHDIQKTSLAQILIVLGFVVSIVIAVILFNDNLQEQPKPLWDFISTSQTK